MSVRTNAEMVDVGRRFTVNVGGRAGRLAFFGVHLLRFRERAEISGLRFSNGAQARVPVPLKAKPALQKKRRCV